MIASIAAAGCVPVAIVPSISIIDSPWTSERDVATLVDHTYTMYDSPDIVIGGNGG